MGMKASSKILLALTAVAVVSLFTAWILSSGVGFTNVSGDNPHSGSYAANSGANFQDSGYLSQMLSTVAEETDILSFWPANSLAAGNGFEVGWNGTVALSNAEAFPHTDHTFSGLAVAHGNLHDVSVTPANHGVPEPFSTLWLALPPFAGMVAFRRFRAEPG
jgi:hypothetical protein